MLAGVPENAFKIARTKAGLKQRAVATALGIEQAAVSKWETGRALPETATFVRLAALYGCSVSALAIGIDPEYDRLLSADDKSVPTESSPYGEPTKARELLRRYEREQADVAATRQALGQQLGEILAQINRAFGGLAATISRLPRGQVAMARRRGSGRAAHRGRRRGRADQRRAPKTPPE